MSSYKFPDANGAPSPHEISQDLASAHPYLYSYSPQLSPPRQPIPSTSKSIITTTNIPSRIHQTQPIPPFNPYSNEINSRKSSANSSSFSSAGGDFEQDNRSNIDPSFGTSSLNSSLNSSGTTMTSSSISGKRKGSNSSGRRMIDGREETREERRIRRDLTDRNYDLTNGKEGDEFTATRRHRSRSHLPANSPPLPSSSFHTPPIASTSTSTTSYFPSSSIQSATNPTPVAATTNNSKSVLTIALQKAQSAVLLDSANNVPEAIAAYSQSVKLLKEVIIRAEESLERERERERVRRATGRVGETEEDKLRRNSRFEKKEKAKLDEGRRLKVIHDTYEDRIRMLISMAGSPSNTAIRSPPTSPVSPTTPMTNSRSPTLSNQSLSPRLRKHRAETSLGSFSGSISSPNTSPHPPPSIALPPPPPDTPTLGEPIDWNNSTTREFTATTPLAPRDTRAAEVIGSAMMVAATPPASPTLPSTPPSGSQRPSRLSRELLGSDGESTPRNFASRLVQNSRTRKTRSSDISSLEDSRDERLTPTLMRRTASEQPPQIYSNRNSTASVSATSHALSRTSYSTDSTLSNSTVPDSMDGSLTRDISGELKTPLIAIEPGSPMDPFFYFDSPPIDDADKEILLEDEKETGIHADHGISFNSNYGNGSGLDSSFVYSLNLNSAGASTVSSVGHSRNHSQSSTASSIPRSTSGNSISSKGSPNVSNSINKFHPYTQPYNTSSLISHSSPSLLADSPTLREQRSASLTNSSTLDGSPIDPNGNRAQFAPFNQGLNSAYREGKLLISQVTTGGTISRRRKGSLVLGIASSTGEEFALEESRYQKEDTGASEDGSDQENFAQSHSFIRAVPQLDSNVDSEFGQLPSTISYSISSNSSIPGGRLRALSQPGRRPPLPNFDQAIPAVPFLPPSRSTTTVPRFMRKSSAPFPSTVVIPPPLLGRSLSTGSKDSLTNSALDLSRGTSPFPSNTNSSIDTPLSANFSISSTTVYRSNLASSSSSSTSYLLPPPPPEALPAIPVSPIRRPFQLMRQILHSIESGGYITPKLYIPQPTWSQTGVKLTSLETKVRMLDLLLNGLELVEKSGEGMLMEFNVAEGEMAKMESIRFGKELEGLEGLVEGIQSTLEKKLGYATSGKKMGTTSFSAWSSKLSRSLDRVTSGRSLDSPATYVEGIARVFKQAQSLDQHILYLSSNEGGYSSITIMQRQKLESRLRRISDFFGQVICRFVLKDLGMLLDKYVKRGSGYLMFD